MATMIHVSVGHTKKGHNHDERNGSIPTRNNLKHCRETLDIEAGTIPAKRYHSVEEMFYANNTEISRKLGS